MGSSARDNRPPTGLESRPRSKTDPSPCQTLGGRGGGKPRDPTCPAPPHCRVLCGSPLTLGLGTEGCGGLAVTWTHRRCPPSQVHQRQDPTHPRPSAEARAGEPGAGSAPITGQPGPLPRSPRLSAPRCSCPFTGGPEGPALPTSPRCASAVGRSGQCAAANPRGLVLLTTTVRNHGGGRDGERGGGRASAGGCWVPGTAGGRPGRSSALAGPGSRQQRVEQQEQSLVKEGRGLRATWSVRRTTSPLG